ncbi:MAG: hypothetical protein ACO200_12525, partial [Steroidobacteraceae bacterium]
MPCDRVLEATSRPAWPSRCQDCEAGLEASIRPWSGAMESLTFPESSLDAIWAEGSIYNMG